MLAGHKNYTYGHDFQRVSKIYTLLHNTYLKSRFWRSVKSMNSWAVAVSTKGKILYKSTHLVNFDVDYLSVFRHLLNVVFLDLSRGLRISPSVLLIKKRTNNEQDDRACDEARSNNSPRDMVPINA